MKVIKIGGGCLKDVPTIQQILKLVTLHGKGHVFVVSALYGITNQLINGIDKALKDESQILPHLEKIIHYHIKVATELITSTENLEMFQKDFFASVKHLERYYFGLNFTGDVSPKMYDAISCMGEVFSSQLLTWVIRDLGSESVYLFPQDIELITDGKFKDATADLDITSSTLPMHITPYLDKDYIVFIPGYYGISKEDVLTTFGRGGSDYSAAVVAASLMADVLEIWKDVDGFMSMDPRFVNDTEFIPHLSYEECAELSYFGATILHPRTVEPVRQRDIDIVIKNTMTPESQGTRISREPELSERVIKSITYTEDIGILKVHASGIGARPGILSIVTDAVSKAGINIKSVVASHTCISFLLAKEDLDETQKALLNITPRPFRKLEREDELVLLAIVGDGLNRAKGVAARCFSAIFDAGVNIEMISFGPSKAALYFLLHQDDLSIGVHAIHSTFFDT